MEAERKRQNWWPLKGKVAAKNDLQGSDTKIRKMLGGMEENSVSPLRGH